MVNIMKNKKLIIGICIGIIAVCVIVATYILTVKKTRIEISDKDSWFSDFEIVDGETRIQCALSVKNNSKEDITFSVNAIFDQDFESGLVSDKTVTGTWDNSGLADITLKAGQELTGEKITFTSKNNGCNTKQDRNLPKLEVRELR